MFKKIFTIGTIFTLALSIIFSAAGVLAVDNLAAPSNSALE